MHWRISLKEFIWVLRHWREYYDVINYMHNEWFNIDVENAPVQYMWNPDMLYCKFCSVKFKPYHVAWDTGFASYGFEPEQEHNPGCLWPRIKKLRGCWYRE